MAPPSADDIELIVIELLDEHRDIAWILLEVAVSRDDQPAPSVSEASRKRRRLTEVPAEANDANARVFALQLFQDGERLVTAAVVDEDDFVASAPTAQRLGELVVERSEVWRLVVDGNNDAYVHGENTCVVYKA